MVKLFYDTETTGVNPNRHSIIQLSGYIEKDDKIVDEFDFSIRPHPKAEIDPEAMAINGKTVEEIQKYPSMFQVFPVFKQILRDYVDPYSKEDKIILVGFNNRKFDDEFLRKLFELNSDQFFNSFFSKASLDVSVLAMQYLLERYNYMPTFKLKRVAIELGLTIDKDRLHDSMYDVEITRDIYRIVTGLENEPAKNFFFVFHPEDQSIAKYECLDDIPKEGGWETISFDEFRHLQHLRGIHDSSTLLR